jgi:hypothetical protein
MRRRRRVKAIVPRAILRVQAAQIGIGQKPAVTLLPREHVDPCHSNFVVRDRGPNKNRFRMSFVFHQLLQFLLVGEANLGFLEGAGQLPHR